MGETHARRLNALALRDEQIRVLGADLVGGGLLIHFSDGLSVLYHSQFLYSVRDDDGNVLIPNEPEQENDTE